MKIHSGLVRGQVLQRLGRAGATAVVRGECKENGPILAALTGAKGWKPRAVGRAAGGRFEVRLTGLPAGGPYDLTLTCGSEKARVTAFYVGDVWLLAGQSNMEGVGLLTGKAKPHPLIRAFSMARVWRAATEPMHVLRESPDRCHHEGTQFTPAEAEARRRECELGTGVGLFFARERIAKTGVPQGLICTAHGGTSMQQWSPGRKNLGGESLYASMLASVEATGQPVVGMLWYQGESDANPTDAPLYTERMKELVAATRRDLRQPGLPWIIAQIGQFFNQPSVYGPWNEIQEQQRLLPKAIRRLEVVATIDLPMDDLIHIGADGYPVLARRMARMAERLVDGRRDELPAPQPRLVRPANPLQNYRYEVVFDHVVGGLRCEGRPLGFTWLNAKKESTSIIHRVVLKDNVALLFLSEGVGPEHRLMYGCGPAPTCNLVDGRGHAVPVFGPMRPTPFHPEILPFVTAWQVSDVVPTPGVLADVTVADVRKIALTPRQYESNGFINEHDRWNDREGLGFFRATLRLPEAMKLRFLMGYDGPFRFWLDGREFFSDFAGNNPCLPDKAKKIVTLKKGDHEIHIGMDLRGGRTWGFFLRFVREGLTARQRAQHEFLRPEYL